ncbi:MAG: acyl-CoA dehydratase activase [Peptococcaceae bacterium]|jgi:predicted CoA-substrate-specific enzyme activase|nr:acyl-CoA dehydratase activase [Peptococcaceae bacterium]
MITAGIDIGSRTIALVVLDNAKMVRNALADTGFNPVETVREMVSSLPPGATVTATGYGRHAARAGCARRAVTEIKAHALGVSRLYPEAGSILDIGGQDMKVILLGGNGSVEEFQMNDKCAAGTGKFLEVMAGALGYPSVEDFGRDSLLGKPGTKISSMCTVFAESEAVSMLHRGIERRDIGRALHDSVVARALGLLQRVGPKPPLAFSGGVARNPCVVKLLEEKLQERVHVPQNPQLVGALGAALAGEAESDIPNP